MCQPFFLCSVLYEHQGFIQVWLRRRLRGGRAQLQTSWDEAPLLPLCSGQPHQGGGGGGSRSTFCTSAAHQVNHILLYFKNRFLSSSHSKPVASFAFDSTTGDFFWSSPEFGIIGRRNVRQGQSEVDHETFEPFSLATLFNAFSSF